MLTDDDLKRELAAAFHEQADPHTRTAISTAGLFWRAARRRRRRAAARAGAVLAVAASVAAAVALVTTSAPPVAKPGTAAGSTGTLLAAAVATAPAAPAAEAGLPPYYVVADHGRPLAYVRDSATGRILSRVPLPPGTDPKQTLVTAAGNHRTFILSVFSISAGTRFYWLRVTDGGRSAVLSPLAVPALPAGDSASAMAVTADGRRLAVAVQASGDTTIEVITVATGAVRSWTAGHGLASSLSWDAAGRRLAVFWTTDTAAAGLWLLDTSSPGTSLPSGRRILPAVVGKDDVQDALITPDAKTIIASVTYDSAGPVHRGAVVGGIVAISAQTGRPLLILLAEHAAYSGEVVKTPSGAVISGWYVTNCLLPAIDQTGSHLLVSCDSFGRLDRGRFTPLPGAAPQTAVAAAW